MYRMIRTVTALTVSSVLFAKTFGIVLVPGGRETIDERYASVIEKRFDAQKAYYDMNDTLKVYTDNERLLRRIARTKGTDGLLDFATKEGYTSITIVTVKSSLLRFKTVPNDKSVQDRKTSSVMMPRGYKAELFADTVLSQTLGLNFQLGVFDVQELY